MMKFFILKTLISIIIITALFGCGNGANSSSKVTNPIATITPVNQQTEATSRIEAEKIKFKTEGGSELFSLKSKTDGTKLVDADGKELARIKTDNPSQIKLKNNLDQTLGYVITNQGEWKLTDSQKQELYVLKRQSNDDYKLLDITKKEIYYIKKRDYGFDIQTSDKNLLYKVKFKEGKASLRDKSDQTIFSTKSNLSPIAFACFGLDTLTREQQATLAYAVNLTGGQ